MQTGLVKYPPAPAQPPESSWPFEKELNKPFHQPAPFGRGAAPRANELDFRRGLHMEINFPDCAGLLETAYADFQAFQKSIGLKTGPCPLVIERVKTSVFEEYRISCSRRKLAISAGDTEGIRRGLVHLEDMILARGNYALPVGVIRRKPVIRTRLSRCAYGPINRPPKCRDELMDDVNYYPDGYLNRLVHNGVNALWLTIKFRDICPSRVVPELSSTSPRRLEKLRRTVRQCARYGIKIYPFCIEPAALSLDSPVFKAHPELKGQEVLGNRAYFCASSATGRAYLEEATRALFSEVPGLGGLICIPVGERFTHCYSGRPVTDCPRCSKRKPWEALADMLAALERGMHSASPGAELVAWPYSQLGSWGPKLTARAAGHMPPNVILQHNFETGGRVKQLGKWRDLWDYWLAWAGPSKNFSDCARAARKNNTRVFAKLQTSCSHEVATTQYVPAPGLIYRKYKNMHSLGVSGAMQGWYFGNYPSLMTKASAALSFAPFPASERKFLVELARRNWGRLAPQIARAWGYFTRGYTKYPGTHLFGYYGPVHDGVVWPLYLEPRQLPVAPTWRIVHPPSGDQVAECFTPDFRYREVVALCLRMRNDWRRGIAIIRRLEKARAPWPECRQEAVVARALGLQLESTCNILLFYLWRDHLASAAGKKRRLELLARLRKIVLLELRNNRELLGLCAQNKTLGFHAEAEGYKYHPAMIKWRMGQLKALMKAEFPRVANQIRSGRLQSFENYTGRGPSILAYHCPSVRSAAALADNPSGPEWNSIPSAACNHWAATKDSEAGRPFPFNSAMYPVAPSSAPSSRLAWRAACDGGRLIFRLEHSLSADRKASPAASPKDLIKVFFQADRLGSYAMFVISCDGSIRTERPVDGIPGRDWGARVTAGGDQKRIAFYVSMKCLGLPARRGAAWHPIRANVVRCFSPVADPLCFSGRAMNNSWAPAHESMSRLVFGYTHPADYGWLVFDG